MKVKSHNSYSGGRISYIIFRTQWKIKHKSPCSKVIENFKMAGVEQWTKHGALYVCGAEYNNYRLNDHEAGLSGWLLSKVMEAWEAKASRWRSSGLSLAMQCIEISKNHYREKSETVRVSWSQIIRGLSDRLRGSGSYGKFESWVWRPQKLKLTDVKVQGLTQLEIFLPTEGYVLPNLLIFWVLLWANTWLFFFSLQLQFPANSMWVFKW